MNSKVRYATVALVATLASLAIPGHAFTLGDAHGPVEIGRSLDISVQVQGGLGDEVAGSCLVAEVYYADVRQAAPTVSVAAAAPGPSRGTMVRVRSAAMVDEPIVTLVLRSTCGATTSRTYVLLSDLPVKNANQASSAALADPSQGSGSVALSAPLLLVYDDVKPFVAEKSPVDMSAATGKKVEKNRTASSNGLTSTKPDHSQVPTKKRSTTARESTGNKSVLRLDPLNILSDRIDALDSGMLFAPTEDALLRGQQVVAMQGDIKALREQTTKSDAKLADLRLQLQQSQSQSQRGTLVLLYVLVALVLICLAGLAWLWLRQQRIKDAQGSWWNGPVEVATETVLTRPHQPVTSLTIPRGDAEEPDARKQAGSGVRTAQKSEIDFDLENFTRDKTDVLERKDDAEPSTSRFGGIHNIGIERILDIRQQADFFVSLGQTERALRILKKQAYESAEINPFVYLDLLALHHSLVQKADFRKCRDAFDQHFNCLLPDFASFQIEGKDLFSYPEVLADLVRTWPSAQTLITLDACIFRNALAKIHPSFDLAAFRDLLVLHALVEEVATDLPLRASLPPGVDFSSSRVANALAIKDAPLPPSFHRIPADPVGAVSSDFLDLDISKLTSDQDNAVDLPAPAWDTPAQKTNQSRWPVTQKPQ